MISLIVVKEQRPLSVIFEVVRKMAGGNIAIPALTIQEWCNFNDLLRPAMAMRRAKMWGKSHFLF
jgi:hypothetical protein